MKKLAILIVLCGLVSSCGMNRAYSVEYDPETGKFKGGLELTNQK